MNLLIYISEEFWHKFIVFLQTYICQNRQCQFLYINKMKFKPQATLQKSETNIFNWVTLSTIPLVSNIWTSSNLRHAVQLLYAKMCSFAHILNESNLTVPWHVKNLLVSTGKNKRKKENNKIEDAKFYQIKTNISE